MNQGLSLDLPALKSSYLEKYARRTIGLQIAIYSMLKRMSITKNILLLSVAFFLLYRMIGPKLERIGQDTKTSLPQGLYLAAKPNTVTDRIVPLASATLMNVILRSFIRRRDYAGAFVVLSWFSFSQGSIRHHILRRIWLGVSKQYRSYR